MSATNNKKYTLVSFGDQTLGTIQGIRKGRRALIGASDLTRLTGLETEAITQLAGPYRTHHIKNANVANHTTCQGAEVYVDSNVALKILEMLIGGHFRPDTIFGAFKTLKPLRWWIRDEVLGCASYIDSGAAMGAQLLYRALGGREGFLPWKAEVARRHPKFERCNGFSGAHWAHSDFEVPMDLALKIALQTGTFGGLMVVHAICKCGFFDGTLLREPIAVTLEGLRGLVFMRHSLVDARMLHAFVQDPAPVGEWVSSMFHYCQCDWEWNVDYYSEAEIDFANLDATDWSDLLFSAGLAKRITASCLFSGNARAVLAINYFRHARTVRVLDEPADVNADQSTTR